MATTATAIVHGFVAVALVVAAVVLTLLGHDGAAAWTAFGGYVGGATVQSVGSPRRSP